MGMRRCCDLCDQLGPSPSSKELPDTWAKLTFARKTHDAVSLDTCADLINAELIDTLSSLLDENAPRRRVTA